MERTLTAAQAAKMLDISLETLYAYVSRGLLRSERVPGNPRGRLYPRFEVEQLLERKHLRADPAKAAAKGLHWGDPVLDSGLTLIQDGRLFYRGLDVIELATNNTLEEVAAYLWCGDLQQASSLFTRKSFLPSSEFTRYFRSGNKLSGVARCQVILPVAASFDASANDFREASLSRTGARILQLLTSAMCGAQTRSPTHIALARSWNLSPEGADAIRAALILSADHELNISAFVARCIASARSTLYEVTAGALATLVGRQHGGHTLLVEGLFSPMRRKSNYQELLVEKLQILQHLPGFGHPLYPEGDPRAKHLLNLARAVGDKSTWKVTQRIIDEARSLTDEKPNLDFGLVALAKALKLPPGSALAIFALGRTTGWIAHAIEQYADKRLIRPRARYIGPTPQI